MPTEELLKRQYEINTDGVFFLYRENFVLTKSLCVNI